MSEKYYVIEKFKQQYMNLTAICEAMPIKRRAIEIYQNKNKIAKARDAYTELESLKKKTIETVMELRLLFVESDMKENALFCTKLYQAVQQFKLMTPDYSKLISTLQALRNQIPRNETTNAKIIGHLMNNVKMGYYPTDIAHVKRIKNALVFPSETKVNILDPCCGCGIALEQLALEEDAGTYGIEIDEERGHEAESRLGRVGFGSYFHSSVSHEAFHALFLNPPYLSVLTEGGSKARSEKRFLVDGTWNLMQDGILIYIIPYYRLTYDICRVLCDNYHHISMYRFMDAEFSKYNQIVLFGVKKKKEDGSLLAEKLALYAMMPEKIPLIDTMPSGRYILPATLKKVAIFKGAVFNLGELERQMAQSKSISALFEKSKIDAMEKRPLLPLNVGQVGLIGGSGLINGYVDCDHPHVIKGRVIKEVKQYENEIDNTMTVIRNNRMLFNILTPDGVKKLA